MRINRYTNRVLQGSRRRRSHQAGYTLIELLAVILVISILMAVALPLYLGTITNSNTTVCRSNMETIANAEQAFRSRNAPSFNYTTNLSSLNTDLGSTPACPQFGTYSVVISNGTATANNGLNVPLGGIVVQCTASGHGKFAPSIDSN
jgi:prepilin-type N-terminal cleavage/methylation domain-containing protein